MLLPRYARTVLTYPLMESVRRAIYGLFILALAAGVPSKLKAQALVPEAAIDWSKLATILKMRSGLTLRMSRKAAKKMTVKSDCRRATRRMAVGARD